MEAFKRNERHGIVVSSIIGVIVAAIVLAAMLVMTQTTQLNRPDVTGDITVVLGSLELIQIMKAPLQEGGSLITMEAKDGLFYYASGWIVLGVVLAVLRLKLADKEDTALY